jgi:LPS sulfotransferase NodH
MTVRREELRRVQRKAKRLAKRGVRQARQVRQRLAPVLRRPGTPPQRADRLVPSPVFLLSTPRSGSTLLRMMLDTHSQICAPHELHLRHVHASVEDKRYPKLAMEGIGLDDEALEHLLWDRIMHRELGRAQKSVFVDKTPQNVELWQRLVKAWPDARFIFLIRHPASIADSLTAARPKAGRENNELRTLRYAKQLSDAAAELPGITVKYEDLCADPAAVTQRVCAYLGVPWEAGMLEYGAKDHGGFKAGLGDWGQKIRSGKVVAPAPLPAPDEVPERLRGRAKAWGYL